MKKNDVLQETHVKYDDGGGAGLPTKHVFNYLHGKISNSFIKYINT